MNTREFNQAVDAHADNLYRFLLKSSRDSVLSQDWVQETFAKLWQHKDAVDPEKIKSWLFSTGYRIMIDWMRREKRVTFSDSLSEDTLVQHGYSDLKEVLDKALQRLPDIQRQLVLLRDYEGYSYEEMGEITGLNESQVKVYIFRARKTLKQYLGSLQTVV